ncbi:hypothetical protein GCM10009682_53590 [Luedemannella flava]|uniref:Uncharacterized protein n=1 Tax=Luedemannella flava TaxID=349316 RepID=A0ABP4YVH3_9ACTN
MSAPSGWDTDRDGMPNAWESANGFNPNAADHNGDADGDGYRNIEEYLDYAAQGSPALSTTAAPTTRPVTSAPVTSAAVTTAPVTSAAVTTRATTTPSTGSGACTATYATTNSWSG